MIKLLETPEETCVTCVTGLDCCLSEEDKRNCHTYVTSIMTITFNMFLNKENIIGCYFPICAISFVSFVCILYRVIFACCAGMFVWLYQITRTCCLMNVMHSWFYVTYHIFKTIPFLRRVLFYQM